MNELIGFIKESLKNNKIVVIKNEDILNKCEIKNTYITYFILSKDKNNNIMRTKITIDNMDLDDINNCYLPELIFNSINENQVTNIFDVPKSIPTSLAPNPNKFMFIAPYHYFSTLLALYLCNSSFQ